MKIGFLFPGQGAQSIGMGKDLYDKYEEYRNVYKKVKEYTGIDVASLTFDGEESTLNETKNTQVPILTMSLGILAILKKYNIKAEVSSGLSLGEYSALIYSKALTFEDGVKLVQKRGEYMQNLKPEGNWQMAAILGMEDKIVEEICSKIKKGFAVPVNYNCPGQVVISGDEEGINEFKTLGEKYGVKKIKLLKTSGPFHTEKLIESSKQFKKELEKIKFHDFETDVVKNIDGEVYLINDDIKDILAKHIINPVRFSKCLNKMIEMGVDTFIEIGPGRTLSGFVRKIPTEKKLNIFNINDVQSLENVIQFMENK